MKQLRLVTWNVNGLRAVLERLKQTLPEFLSDLNADIICLQETKLTRSELNEEHVRPPGFDAFYSFCRYRGGYSGVVTFVRSTLPTVAADEGLTGLWQTKDSVGHVGSLHNELPSGLVKNLEAEGRCVITDHQAFVLLNTYCPALASADRLDYKLHFHALLQDRVMSLRAANKHVIVVGDINIAHRDIDHCEPHAHQASGLAFSDHPCRKWMDSFVAVPNERQEVLPSEPGSDTTVDGGCSHKLVDTFRYFHPHKTKAFTCWNTQTQARQTNYGSRIDYILTDVAFLNFVTSCSIDVERLGSDHCPVIMSCTVDLKADSRTYNDRKTAALCAKHFVEFSGTQQSIRSFVVRGHNMNDSEGQLRPLAGYLNPKRTNRGQQFITSFLSHTGSKNKSSAKRKECWRENLAANYCEVVRISKKAAFEKPKEEWANVLNGRPPQVPLCKCGQPTVLRSVIKANDNRGRKFYVCTKPVGEKKNPDARCDFFKWADSKSIKNPSPANAKSSINLQ
ncbi:putative AP endonuclease 1, endonuclease/exonuclease/phosphatase, Zinc finger, GRF-type [Plasmopara halstedii]